MSGKVEVVEYSEKAVAVFGNTEPYKAAIAEAGGKFNRSLKYGDTEQRIPGWIFSKARMAVVKQLVKDINEGKLASESSETRSRPTSSKNFEGVDKKAYLALVSRVEELEQELALIKQHMGIKMVAKPEKAPGRPRAREESGESESEDEKAPPRLLKPRGRVSQEE